MAYAGKSYVVPMKSLGKAHQLPPQRFFSGAQGVLCGRLTFKVQPNRTWSRLYERKGHDVYLVTKTGYLFLFAEDKFGYAVPVRDAEKKLTDGSKYEISLTFKYADVKLEFGDRHTHAKWLKVLSDLLHSKVDYDAKEVAFPKNLPDVVDAYPHSGGKKVEVRRYPAGARVDGNSLFKETVLQSPRQTSSRRSISYVPTPRHATPYGRRQQREEFNGEEEDPILAQGPAAPQFHHRTPSLAGGIPRRRKQWSELHAASLPPQDEQPKEEEEMKFSPDHLGLTHRTPSPARPPRDGIYGEEAPRVIYKHPTPSSLPPTVEPGAPAVENFEALKNDATNRTPPTSGQRPPVTPRIKIEHQRAKTPTPRRLAAQPGEVNQPLDFDDVAVAASEDAKNEETNRTPPTSGQRPPVTPRIKIEHQRAKTPTPRRLAAQPGEVIQAVDFGDTTEETNRTPPSSGKHPGATPPSIKAEYQRARTPPRFAAQPGEVYQPLDFDASASETSSSSMEQQQALRTPSPAPERQQQSTPRRSRRTPSRHAVAAAQSPEASDERPTPRRSGRKTTRPVLFGYDDHEEIYGTPKPRGPRRKQ